jgi:ribosomal protein S18 acetylase RimI-like enzyme
MTWTIVEPAFRIRRARDEDLASVAELAASTFRREEVDPDALVDSNQHHVAIDDDGDVAAYVSWRVETRPGETVLWIESIAVAPFARGNRLQARLLRAALKWGEREGAMVARSYTAPSNAESINGFVRAGFSATRVPGDGEDRWCHWVRPLSPAAAEVPGSLH